MLRATSLVLVVLTAAPAAAESLPYWSHLNDEANGEYVIEFSSPAVLDYSYHGFVIPGTWLDLDQDVRGKLTGKQTTNTVTVKSEAVITGKVKTVSHLPYVQITTIDEGVIDGDPTRTVTKLRAILGSWGPDAVLVGEMFTKFCMLVDDPIADRKRRICMPQRHALEERMPDIGVWDVRLTLRRSGSGLFGAGWITTDPKRPTRRSFEANVEGSISSRTGLATVRLRPTEKPSPGMVTVIGKVGEDSNGHVYFLTVHEVKGKLLGQSFDEVYDSNDVLD